MLRRQVKVMMINKKQSYGFSMIELLVAMVVGLIIISGAFSLHSTTRKTQIVNEAQMDMVADARFAIELISYDLRHAGVWGGTNRGSLIDCRYKGAATASCTATSNSDVAPVAMTGDCEQGWYYNLDVAVFAENNANPFSTTCIPGTESYTTGTDVLQIRYAEATEPATLLASQAYIRSHFNAGRVFIGTTVPLLDTFDASPLTKNHELHAYAYYISDFTDSSGDGIPSLRRVALVNGPALQNQTLLSGVVDLQVQFGVDLTGNKMIDSYVNPSAGLDASTILAAKIWLLMRTDKIQKGVDTTKSFSLAGQTAVNYGGVDDYRYFMVTSVVNLRNLKEF